MKLLTLLRTLISKQACARSKLYLIALVFTLVHSVSMAARDSGGGGGVVCIDENGQSKYSLLEFFENENKLAPFDKFNFRIVRSDEDPEVQARRAIERIKKINPILGAEVQRAYNYITQHNIMYCKSKNKSGRICDEHDEDLDDTWALSFPLDTLQPFQKKNCKGIGLGIFHDGQKDRFYEGSHFERLNYNYHVVEKLLSKTDNAAFKVHEAVYYVFRNFSGHSSSVISRILTVLAFSDAKLPDLSAKPPGATASYRCENKKDSETQQFITRFYLHTGMKDLPGHLEIVPVATVRIDKRKNGSLGISGYGGGVFFFDRSSFLYDLNSNPLKSTEDYIEGLQGQYDQMKLNVSLIRDRKLPDFNESQIVMPLSIFYVNGEIYLAGTLGTDVILEEGDDANLICTRY